MPTLEQELQILKEELRSIKQLLLSQYSPWLSMQEAATYANCSVRTIQNLVNTGDIQAHKTGQKGSTVSISRKSIDNYKSRLKYKAPYAVRKAID